MVLSRGGLIGHDTGSFRLLTRSKGLAFIVTLGLCSTLYLTWFLPGFSVKNEFDRLLPTTSAANGTRLHWDNKPRRLIVFGDSWSDNGQYPVDPPSKDQMPSREEARGKVWTEWLCSAASYLYHDGIANSHFDRFLALTMTILPDRYLTLGTVDTLAQLSTAIF